MFDGKNVIASLYGPQRKRPLKDIAEVTGVPTAWVLFALNGEMGKYREKSPPAYLEK